MSIIQFVPLPDNRSLFILGYGNEVLTFRTSDIPEYKQVEKIKIIDGIVYTNLLHFHISFLNTFIMNQ
jgi:hypothetical protein